MRRYVKGYFGEQWGWIENDVYITIRNRQSHYCFKYRGWGIEYDLFKQLEPLNVMYVKIICHDGSEVYNIVSSISIWKKHGKVDRLNPQCGKQIFLEEKHMEVRR